MAAAIAAGGSGQIARCPMTTDSETGAVGARGISRSRAVWFGLDINVANYGNAKFPWIEIPVKSGNTLSDRVPVGRSIGLASCKMFERVGQRIPNLTFSSKS